MKKRDIIIVFVVIAFGLIYNAFKSGDIDFKFYHSVPVKTWKLLDKNHPHDFLREEIQYPRVDKIEIRSTAGDIEVEKTVAADQETNTPGIKIQPIIRVYHRNKDQAEEIEKKVKIATLKTPRTGDPDKKILLRIEVDSEEDFPMQRARVLFKVMIPETVELNLRNRYGDIEIDGCGKNISLDGRHGDISVKHVDSALKITHRDGRVALTDVNGNIDLSSRHSRIKINNVSDLKLNCYLANADISQVENKTHIEYAGYSSITMDDSNECSIEARHTKIKLKNIKNNVQIKNSHQSIIMKNINGNILINANNCGINLDQIVSEDVVIKNAYNYVSIDNISSKKLDVLLSNGDLDVAFSQIKEKINIKNRHSKVTLMYPSSLQPLFNIQVLYGSLTNRTSGDLTILKERERVLVNSNYLEGIPEITIDTTYGDILLENREIKKIEKAFY
ncbi:MAG: DUF4097 family beta strand repeat protein [Candidatus Aminicenantes bacterium]|nr:MAG: DUF4097 family beta strand repeat protein [Candidatus Aminicenantes bacterium]